MNKKQIMTKIMDKIKEIGGETIPITGHRPVFVGAIDRISCGTYHGSRDCVDCGSCLLSDEEYIQAYGHLRTPMIREHQAISALDVHEIIKKINYNMSQLEKISRATLNIDTSPLSMFAGLDYDPEDAIDNNFPCRNCGSKSVACEKGGRYICIQSDDNARYYAPCEAQEVDKVWVPDEKDETESINFDIDKTEAELCCEGCPQHEWCKGHGLVGTCYKED